ncbi:MAG TPA: flagellar biosynthesis protein FlhB [Candidatus Acidoferrales bacterium]|nr:flagellar biosynthesis protein FlhB [Candidatus Acidoferrales bacterium]
MSENENGQERSESATAKRRQDARDKGQIARSVELSASAVLLGGAATIFSVGGRSLAAFANRVLQESAASLSSGAMTPVGATNALRTVALGLVAALGPFFAGVAGVTIAVNLFQSRAAMSFSPLQPNFSRLSPVAGFKRLLGLDSVVNLLKSLLKLAALGTVTWLVLRRSWPELVSLADTGPAAVLAVMRTLGFRLVFLTGLAFLIVAIADYAWQVVRHEKNLRMSKQEVILEHKEAEGDPRVKGRIRQIQRQRVRQRMLQAVPRADVVVTNPTHVAVALVYDPDTSQAPLVVAMGERKLAERIKQIAREAGVPLVENKPIARALLATCAIGKPIPPALYAAVAEILAFVYRLRNPRYRGDAGARAAA